MRKAWMLIFLGIWLLSCSLFQAAPTLPPAPTEPFPTEPPAAGIVPPSNQSDQCKNPYYPVINGAVYSYRLSSGENVTRTIQTEPASQKFAILISGAGTSSRIEGECTSEGLVIMESPGSTTTTSGEDGSSTIMTQSSSGVSLPYDLAPGKQWSQTIRVTTEAVESVIQMDYRAAGFEEVTVPAGTFTALKIEQNGYVTVFDQNVAMEGLAGWYVEGIGLVKFESPGAPVSELVSYAFP
ncbi:MAG: hypothetical protein LDL51_09475 [Chloroflexi bacterium]|nr:hypothetical protein [Chloroflexota bacterium]